MVIILLLTLLTGGMILLDVRNPEVHFSREEAFQEEAFDLTLSAGIRGGTIYYTLNGDTPTTESDVYTAPIRVEAGLPMETTVVKAMVVRGGVESSVYTQTYFVGQGVSELFDTMVVSLTTDQANLYDEKTGIFTNWNEINDENGSWERPAYIEFYELYQVTVPEDSTRRASSSSRRNSTIWIIQDSIMIFLRPIWQATGQDSLITGWCCETAVPIMKEP